MPPLTTASGAAGNGAAFTSINVPPLSRLDGSEIIEIDVDEDAEPVDEYAEDEDEENDHPSEEDERADDREESNGGSSMAQINGTSVASADTNSYSAANHREINTSGIFTSAGAQQALSPLRRAADRVTRQIEAFAEKLDQYKLKEARSDEFNKLQAAWALVKSYHNFAEDAIKDLSKRRTLKRAKSGWDARPSNGSAAQDGTADAETETELKRLRLELHTWRLFSNLLSIEDPSRQPHEKQLQENAFQRLHRYSSDREIWDTFIDVDHYARECLVVMKWLEHVARESEDSDIDALISDLESQAERGRGLWAHGWLYTKESIKGQKRLRAWPQPLEPKDAGVALSLLSSENHEPLITQLDPDAVIRQKQSLQKQDQFYERATWLTCWKMLRHGFNWTEIRDWSRERLENWRAISLCGASVENRANGERTPADDSTTRMMNFRSQETWRAACSALARNPNADEFERAVYALLCGETEPAYKVCHTWDDHLYVFFNSILLSRYQNFCRQLQRKLSRSPASPIRFVPESPAYHDVRQFVEHVRVNGRLASESRNPFRTIDTVILSRSYDSFFISLAEAVASPEPNEPDLAPPGVDKSVANVAQDGDALRIATHIYIIATSLGYVRTDEQFVESAAACLLGYISDLEEVGLYEHIPLYVSFLPTHRAQNTLSQILLEITDPHERRKQVRALKKHRINLEAVLDKQWEEIYSQITEPDESRDIGHYSKIAYIDGTPDELMPVKKDYIEVDVPVRDDLLIRSLEWRRYIRGQWDKICHFGTILYRDFYVSGRLASARELMKRMNLSDISREAFGIDLSELPIPDEDGMAEERRNGFDSAKSEMGHSRSSSHEVFSLDRQSILYQRSHTMRDLEQLINGFDALENFALRWEEFDQKQGQKKIVGTKDLKEAVAAALDDASLSVQPMLDKWLIPTGNAAMDVDLQKIKATYLPELILEYHSAIYYAAHAVSSELLFECLNLATRVASAADVTDTFVQAHRMAELVDVFALSSRAMVNVKSKNKKKKFPGGETLAIWDIDAQVEVDDELIAEART